MLTCSDRIHLWRKNKDFTHMRSPSLQRVQRSDMWRILHVVAVDVRDSVVVKQISGFNLKNV